MLLDKINETLKLQVQDEFTALISHGLYGEAKRVRPMLALSVAQSLSLEESQILPFAIGLELLHTASLIHDDLPGLDNDTVRRGKSTLHVEFGVGPAVLTGDYLISEAIRICLSNTATTDNALKLAQVLATANTKLCRGQLIDLQITKLFQAGETDSFTPAELEQKLLERDTLKTGALFAAAMQGPALIAANCGQEMCSAMQSLGEKLGLIFQLADDLADSQSNEANYLNLLGAARTLEIGHNLVVKVRKQLAQYKLEDTYATSLLALIWKN